MSPQLPPPGINQCGCALQHHASSLVQSVSWQRAQASTKPAFCLLCFISLQSYGTLLSGALFGAGWWFWADACVVSPSKVPFDQVRRFAKQNTRAKQNTAAVLVAVLALVHCGHSFAGTQWWWSPVCDRSISLAS